MTWDEAADWYLRVVSDGAVGFNDLASDVAVGLLGPCEGLRVLDVGCGEGHVSRRLARAGALVVGVEPVQQLLDAALRAEGEEALGIAYRRDSADELATVVSTSVDAVLAVLVLHHVADLSQALAQARRVLRPGGRLVAVLPHPWTDHPGAAWAGGPHRMIGDYADEGYWSTGDGTSDVQSVRDIGWYHRTLATWLTAVAEAGFRLERVLEPIGSASGRPDGGGEWAAVPRFLAFSATSG